MRLKKVLFGWMLLQIVLIGRNFRLWIHPPPQILDRVAHCLTEGAADQVCVVFAPLWQAQFWFSRLLTSSRWALRIPAKAEPLILCQNCP